MQLLAIACRSRGLLVRRNVNPGIDGKFGTYFNPLITGSVQHNMPLREGRCVGESSLAT